MSAVRPVLSSLQGIPVNSFHPGLPSPPPTAPLRNSMIVLHPTIGNKLQVASYDLQEVFLINTPVRFGETIGLVREGVVKGELSEVYTELIQL
jgi:hypothetical protein